MRRNTNKPCYLQDYYLKVDLRTISSKKSAALLKKIQLEDDEELNLWWSKVILNVRSKMDHSKARNFSLVVGIVISARISKLFSQFDALKRKRVLKFRLNEKSYAVDTFSWRFNNSSIIFPNSDDIKIYLNDNNEYIKVELKWIRFKYNRYSNILTCSGKFDAFLFSNNLWERI